uniref:Uncharacterized protein n=1 Tax=Arundo donax TaxID=35708 RepID=A0A0A9EWW7_ARUDO
MLKLIKCMCYLTIGFFGAMAKELPQT